MRATHVPQCLALARSCPSLPPSLSPTSSPPSFWRHGKQVKVVCSGESIPKVIEVDIAGLDIGQRIFLRDLKVPQGVELGVCVCVCVCARALRMCVYVRTCVRAYACTCAYT